MLVNSLHLNVHCCSQNCQHIFNTKEHVLLGISPFNSYYTENNISLLVNWAAETFKKFHIFIPDTLPIYNFLALGYSKEKAQQKTIRQARYLKNKIVRACKAWGFSAEYAHSLIIDMGKLQTNECYQRIKTQCYELFANDESFHHECIAAITWILNGYQSSLGNQVDAYMAVRYLLDEMPLFIDTPTILNTPCSLFCYHQTPSFIQYLYSLNSRPTLLSLQQGFIEVNIENQYLAQADSIKNELNQ